MMDIRTSDVEIDIEIKAMLLSPDGARRSAAAMKIIERYGVRVRGCISRRCWNIMDPAELWGESLGEVCITIAEYNPHRGSLGTWWTGKARLLALHEATRRKRARSREVAYSELAEPADEMTPSPLERLIDTQDPEQSHGKIESKWRRSRELLHEAIAKLHPVDRAVIQAFIQDKYQPSVLAKRLGVSEGRIRNAKSNIVKNLKKALARVGHNLQIPE